MGNYIPNKTRPIPKTIYLMIYQPAVSQPLLFGYGLLDKARRSNTTFPITPIWNDPWRVRGWSFHVFCPRRVVSGQSQL